MRQSSSPDVQPSWRTVVRWPAFLLANVALLIVIGISTARETYRGWTVDHDISALQAQAASLEGDRVQLETLTKELSSSDRVDYDARARLGMQKPGEHVIVLEGVSTSSSWSGDGDPLLEQASVRLREASPTASNPQRWWNYFFLKKTS